MMKVNFRIEKEVKEQADKLFQDLGLNMTSALNLFIRQSIREQGIPFKIDLGGTPNKMTLDAIEEVEKGELETFDTVDSLMKDLNS